MTRCRLSSAADYIPGGVGRTIAFERLCGSAMDCLKDPHIILDDANSGALIRLAEVSRAPISGLRRALAFDEKLSDLFEFDAPALPLPV